MSEVGSVYAQALYTLAREEHRDQVILEQLQTLDDCFAREPDYIRLLCAPNLPKAERCQILDDCFRGKIDAYLLNFLKILTEKGYMRHFPSCTAAYQDLYYQDHGILPVTAVTAVALTQAQQSKLTETLCKRTGKQIALTNKVDASVLGGVRLSYGGQQIDDTIAHRLAAIGSMLSNTEL